MEYILRNSAAKQISLDEQAKRYGGEAAAERFREDYRRRFLDAAEGYRDTMEDISEAMRKAREDRRLSERQELDRYVEQARQTLRERAEQGMDTGKTTAKGYAPEGVDIDDYVAQLEEKTARAKEERLQTVLREDFRGSEAMEKLGIRITGTVTDQYQNAAEIRRRQEAAEQARRAIRKAERRLNATEGERNFAAGITSGVYTESDIPSTMNAEKVMELADYYMGEPVS